MTASKILGYTLFDKVIVYIIPLLSYDNTIFSDCIYRSFTRPRPLTMDITKQIEYWKKSAEHDLDTANSLIQAKKYDWALFLSHLVLEKMLKAIFVKKKKSFPPKTHNLILLLKELGFEISEDEYDFFEEVNTFNISTRYPDEQLTFY